MNYGTLTALFNANIELVIENEIIINVCYLVKETEISDVALHCRVLDTRNVKWWWQGKACDCQRLQEGGVILLEPLLDSTQAGKPCLPSFLQPGQHSEK